MHTIKYLLALFLVLAAGCTPLIVREPIGSNFSPEELKAFEGTWKLEPKDQDPIVIHLKNLDAEGRFRSAVVEWDKSKRNFDLNTSELLFKKGGKYGILHLAQDDTEEIPEGLFFITLFQIRDDGKVTYWGTKAKGAEKFLESGVLKTETVDDNLILTDEPAKIIQALESGIEEIFDVGNPTLATKLF